MIHRLQRVYRHPNSDISLAELAAFVGVDRKTMRRWMNDDRW
jgi:predicted DNA-binding transcriptional regulator AlpA